jgi:hypothetical protein
VFQTETSVAAEEMNGNEGDSMDVEIGVPQGSPVWPVVVIIYLSGLFSKVEQDEQERGREGISVLHDVVEGQNVGKYTQRVERCTTETMRWAKENACQFNIE